MKTHYTLIGIIAVSSVLSSSSHAQLLSQEQELTPEQKVELVKVGTEFSQQGEVLDAALKTKFAELILELKREGRLASEAAAKEGSTNVTKLLEDISELYGDLVQTKVSLFLNSKNVLTVEQRQHLLHKLNPQASIPFESTMFMQPDIFDLPLNLDRAQRKKMIKLKATLMVKEVELERDVELVLIDIEALLMADKLQPEKTDPLIKELGTLAAKELDNRVNFVIKAKDVLTLDQRRMLAYLMELD
jgi:hypothetical protein